MLAVGLEWFDVMMVVGDSVTERYTRKQRKVLHACVVLGDDLKKWMFIWIIIYRNVPVVIERDIVGVFH